MLFSRLLRTACLAAAFGLTAASAGADEITVTHWGSAFYGAPYAVAMEKGWFKEAGANITGILTSTGGGTSVRNTLAGGLPYGEVALPAALEALKSGEKLVMVNSGVGTVADIVWAVKPDSPLKTVKDLKGKKVSYTRPASVTNMLILMILEKEGMKASDVTLVAAGGLGANFTALMQGAVDTAIIGEPIWTKEKSKLRQLFNVGDIIPPNMTQTVGVVTPEFMKDKPDVLKAIIEGRRRGTEFLYKNVEEAADITAKAYKMDAPLVREVFQALVKIRYWDNGKFDFDGMNRMVEGMRIVGQLDKPVDWSTVVDQSFLPKDLQASLR